MNITFTNTISAENYSSLRKAVGFSEVSESQVQTALDRSDFVIVANINSNPIGMARLMTDGLQVLIMDVIVSPDYQGKGVGRSIMEHIMNYIQSLVCGDKRILINLMTGNKKVGFYEKFGFKRSDAGMIQWIKQDSL